MPTSATPDQIRKNHLLGALPVEEFERVSRHLVPVSLKLGKVLDESGDRMDFLYFPTTSIVSRLYIMENGTTAEIGVVGNEGILALHFLWEAIRRLTGRSFRVPVMHLRLPRRV